MKNFLQILFSVVLGMSIKVYAQGIGEELDSELDQVSPQQQEVVQPQVVVAPTSKKKVILKADAVQVQKQPVTVIEASPLTESKAEQMRKARVDTEMQTEQKIVEKLEQSRIDDEKKRAQVLFGDKFNQMNGEASPPAPQQQSATQPALDTRQMVKEEIRDALSAERELEKTPLVTKYMSLGMGIVELPGVVNATGNYSFNMTFGKKIDSLLVEGGLFYGNYSIDSIFFPGYYNTYGQYTPARINVDQFAGSLGVKYEFFDGMIKPVVGALVQYSYRSFNLDSGYGYYQSLSASSQAVDVGLSLGVNLDITENFVAGLDAKYLTNMYSKMDSKYSWRSSSLYGTPIEKVSYWVWSINGLMTF